MKRALPSAFDTGQLEVALHRFRRAVGDEHVVTTEADLECYLDPFRVDAGLAHIPVAAVRPHDTDQVQAVVRIANDLRVPLWTVSTGKNFAYGGGAPRLSGCVILDLHRMNRVLEVNEDLGYVIVEPGVSYFDLHAYMRDQRIALWIDPPAPGWGSVVGNTVERGFGYTPYGDHAAMQCGMEVVLPDGQLLRTGMGAMANNAAWPLYKPGYGPAYDGIFMQSNFGIVTKMGLWLMPRPEAIELCRVVCRHESDLETLIDVMRPLRLDGTVQNYAVIESAIRWAASISSRREWYDGAGAMPPDVVAQMIERLDIGWWTLRFALYGRREVVDLHRLIVKRAFEKIPDAIFTSTSHSPDDVPEAVGDKGQMGIPSLAAFRMLDWRGGNGAHIDFSPICPATGRDAMRQYQLVKVRAAAFGFDYYGGFTLGVRHLHHIFAAIFDRGDRAQAEQAGLLLQALVTEAASQGYAEYRAHLDTMDAVAAQYGFNEHALLRFHERLKDAIDPHGIVSPGKQGIWPAVLRGGKA